VPRGTIGGLTERAYGETLNRTNGHRCDNRSVFLTQSDRVAALIALAAIAAAVIANVLHATAYPWFLLAIGVAMLLLGTWWLTRQSPGTPFREMALPAAVATVMPVVLASIAASRSGFSASSIVLSWNEAVAVGTWLLEGSAVGLLGLRLAAVLPERHRPPTMIAVGALAVLGSVFGILGGSSLLLLAYLTLGAGTVVPGLLAAAIPHTAPSAVSDRQSVTASLELGVIGLTPAIALVTMWNAASAQTAAIPLIAWILVVFAAQFFAVRPLARTANVATAQRDIVVAAMEAERSRIAADIHDDALQELTLLSWRLDAAGDNEGAAQAREVATRLRQICGDLRLPILDDLGAGPALEWLVERIGRLAGGEVRLERADQVRPPAAVELAFFRVAQEAVSNAVRHGRPPIVVRYWTSPSSASLSVADAGPGIDPTRFESQPEMGHFGLVNMRQRAEQIGALLDVRRWPTGGTQVALEWRAPQA
jgi:signal transduction histidine kinase